MFNTLSRVVVAPIFAAHVASPVSAQVPYKEYGDRDWSTRFSTGCGLPKRDSIQRVRIDGDRKIRAYLRPGDIGQCDTDNLGLWGQKWFERADLSQKGQFGIGAVYEISWTMAFEQGYIGKNENFATIHSRRKPCLAMPILQYKVHYGKLKFEVTRGLRRKSNSPTLSDFVGHYEAAPTQRTLRVTDLYGKELRIRTVLDLTDRKRASVYINDELIVDNVALQFADCARPYLNFGVYRPGPPTPSGNGPTPKHVSSALFDDFQIRKR